MFEKNFIFNNLKKIKNNFKKKKINFNKGLFNKLYKIKKKILKKIFFYNKKKKIKLKKTKIYILKLINIYKFYLKLINKNFKLLILKLPNLTHNIVMKKNIIIKEKKFKLVEKEIEKIKKKMFNFKISEKTSGRGFFFINTPLSIFYENLINYILKIHIKEHNYKYVIVPEMMKFKSLINSGQLPKFIKKLFVFKDNKKIKYMIPTSEVSLINFFLKKSINSKFLPIKLISKTKCYRNENIFYGKNNKNIIKQKQFDKVELLQLIDNKNSYKYLKELIKNVEKIVKRFEISYRIVKLSRKDLGQTSLETYDFEIWIPSLNNYCEISSCSNTENYQSIRSKIKYIKNKKNKEYCSIINGSGVAIGRFFLSIIENNKINKIKF